jgi:hypothetical protein
MFYFFTFSNKIDLLEATWFIIGHFVNMHPAVPLSKHSISNFKFKGLNPVALAQEEDCNNDFFTKFNCVIRNTELILLSPH